MTDQSNSANQSNPVSRYDRNLNNQGFAYASGSEYARFWNVPEF